MNESSRQFAGLVMAGAFVILLGGHGAAYAQPSLTQQEAGRFVTVGAYHINLRQVVFVKREASGDATTRILVHLAGISEPLSLLGKDADAFMTDALGYITGDQAGGREVKPTAEAGGDKVALLAFDGFEGKLGLNWMPVRPDPSHVSLTKKPGTLTITTQRGSIHGEEKKDEFGGGTQAKNLYLIDNPLAAGGDFVVTTCVSGFTPETSYQQAGLIVYNDDDNYLKFGYEYNWQNAGGQAFCILTETDAQSAFHYVDNEHSGMKRYWVRLIKRGSRYEYTISADGKTFKSYGEVEWGDGSPKRIGILAKNGGNKDATELDANFEFFELRSPPPPRSPDEARKE